MRRLDAGKETSVAVEERKAAAFVRRLLSGEHCHDLGQNVLLNPAAEGRKDAARKRMVRDDALDNNWTHVELTDEHIRIEFRDATSRAYRWYAELLCEAEAGSEDLKHIPKCQIPEKVENLTSVGGGATIYLRRATVTSHLLDGSTSTTPLGLLLSPETK